MRRIAISVLLAIAAVSPVYGQVRLLLDSQTQCGIMTDVAELNGISWNGPCAGQLANGRGVLVFKRRDGRLEKYEGEMRAGRIEGRGTYTLPNGSTFAGDFRNDKPDGRGVLTWPTGDRYEGEMRDGKYNGHGTMILAGGGRYVGEYRDGKANGYGTKTNAAGRSYSGQWTNGCFRDGNFWATAGSTPQECGFK
jgi:hypothetical protein